MAKSRMIIEADLPCDHKSDDYKVVQVVRDDGWSDTPMFTLACAARFAMQKPTCAALAWLFTLSRGIEI